MDMSCRNCVHNDAVTCMEMRLTPGYYSDEFWLAEGAPSKCHCKCHEGLLTRIMSKIRGK